MNQVPFSFPLQIEIIMLFFSCYRKLWRSGSLPADGAEEGSRLVCWNRTDFRIRKNKPFGRAWRIYFRTQPCSDFTGTSWFWIKQCQRVQQSKYTDNSELYIKMFKTKKINEIHWLFCVRLVIDAMTKECMKPLNCSSTMYQISPSLLQLWFTWENIKPPWTAQGKQTAPRHGKRSRLFLLSKQNNQLRASHWLFLVGWKKKQQKLLMTPLCNTKSFLWPPFNNFDKYSLCPSSQA